MSELKIGSSAFIISLKRGNYVFIATMAHKNDHTNIVIKKNDGEEEQIIWSNCTNCDRSKEIKTIEGDLVLSTLKEELGAHLESIKEILYK
jgi:hypothetical protein